VRAKLALDELQTDLKAADVASHLAGDDVAVSALNQMIDITTRTMATQFHQPTIIFVMLVVLALASSLLAGYGLTGSRSQRWIHMLGFAAILSLAIYVIFDSSTRLVHPGRPVIRC
jgi:hypothetical protein